ncbi:ABC transporter permease subunit [Bacillus sp. T33-2]|uniref:ABC transporter permease subunit n=1 Tax=Bacillus sp. T33-2 TaxID=2054168 RepID=UPI000C7890D9|nr:ABC transporter permease subunit [Bacillus sp. T33-2]PLR94433.1 peptide ABC transporter permease [Bacillus sp. T33-2]
MWYLRFLVNQLISLAVLLLLAALPLYLVNTDTGVAVQLHGILEEVKKFVAGLFNGQSFYYLQGGREGLLLNDLTSFFLSSFTYLTVSLLIVVILSFFLGIWFWKMSERWLNSLLGFVGFIPDFILVLLFQLLVTYIFKTTGIKTVKVASLSMEEPAIFLPIVSLIIVPLFYLIRTLAERTYEVLTQDYILTAKSKGLSKKYIYVNHVTSNVLPFLKADLHKIVGIAISNLFIIEYLYNTRGLTEILFEYPIKFGYQYNLVAITLIAFFVLYLATFLSIKLFILAVERIFWRA